MKNEKKQKQVPFFFKGGGGGPFDPSNPPPPLGYGYMYAVLNKCNHFDFSLVWYCLIIFYCLVLPNDTVSYPIITRMVSFYLEKLFLLKFNSCRSDNSEDGWYYTYKSGICLFMINVLNAIQ